MCALVKALAKATNSDDLHFTSIYIIYITI